MDIVLKLRELRRVRGLLQKEVAARSGVGEKTLSSFETGARIEAMKLAQLKRVLAVYGVTLAAFFSSALDAELEGAPLPIVEQFRAIAEPLAPTAQQTLIATVATLAAALPHGGPPARRDTNATLTRERRTHGAHPAAPALAAR